MTMHRDALIKEMLAFYDQQIAELDASAEALIPVGHTHVLGLFMQGQAKAHRHLSDWCSRVLASPCPSPEEHRVQAQYWLACCRILIRQVAVWQWRKDFDEEWLFVAE